jgi:hypothetical protein
VRKVSKIWKWESRSREVRHPNCDVSRVGHRSECKTGGGDWRSREFGAHKFKAQIFEGLSREARGSKSTTGESRHLGTSGTQKSR